MLDKTYYEEMQKFLESKKIHIELTNDTKKIKEAKSIIAILPLSEPIIIPTKKTAHW